MKKVLIPKSTILEVIFMLDSRLENKICKITSVTTLFHLTDAFQVL